MRRLCALLGHPLFDVETPWSLRRRDCLCRYRSVRWSVRVPWSDD